MSPVRGRLDLGEPGELAADVRRRFAEARTVRLIVEPAARPRRVGQGDHDRFAAGEALADRVGEPRQPEHSLQRETADGDDQLRPQQLELPVAPELAQILLSRGGCAVAPAGRGASRVAARDGCAVEVAVELVAVDVEPAPQRLPGAASTIPGAWPRR